METKFKKALNDKYNIDFECFASPINSYYTKYCSLFYDIDKYFGSFGNYYLVKYNRGFYIANPPYEPYMLKLMVNKFIESCKNTNEKLLISFGLPNWGNNPAKYGKFEAIDIARKTKYLEFERCMKNGEVWWYDRTNNHRIKIPSHCRFIIGNEKSDILKDEFNDLINKYWIPK